MDAKSALVDAIEALIHEDVGRGLSALFAVGQGGLRSAAAAIAAAPSPKIGILTGFFVPAGNPPAAETDGPVGAALMAYGLARIGIECRMLTDELCQGACEASLAAAGLGQTPVDVVPLGEPIETFIERWRGAGINFALSIERCGRSADGRPRNMRGIDISAHTPPLDELFLAGPWETIAIADGGNEIGIGSVPRALIARHVVNGGAIACVTPSRHLILAGVSHWGAYALLGALAALREDWRPALLESLSESLDSTILEATVRQGPAVDGISSLQMATIDSFGLAIHHRKLGKIRTLVQLPSPAVLP